MMNFQEDLRAETSHSSPRMQNNGTAPISPKGSSIVSAGMGPIPVLPAPQSDAHPPYTGHLHKLCTPAPRLATGLPVDGHQPIAPNRAGAIRLPDRPPGATAAPNKRNGDSSPPSTKASTHRVLVVDDNIDSAESLALLLSLDGHEVRTAFDGPAALTVATDFQPEAVLLDIGLPGMDGYEVVQRLRSLPSVGQALMIAITGYGQDDDRARSLEAGFDHHLVKPVDPDTLSNLLNSL